MSASSATTAPPLAPSRPRAKLSMPAILGIIALAIFTVFITWRAKVLETDLRYRGQDLAVKDKPAPDFSAPALDGSTVALADFRGKKQLVVSFWASWCGPCRMEMPTLKAFYERNHKDSSEFELLAISIDEDTAAAKAFAGQQKLNFPVLLDDNQKIARDFKVNSIPSMFVIDKDGKLVYGHVGYDPAMQYRLMQLLGLKETDSTGGKTDATSSH